MTDMYFGTESPCKDQTHRHHLSYPLRVIHFLLHVLDGFLQSSALNWRVNHLLGSSGRDLAHHSRVVCPQVLPCVPPWLRWRPRLQPSQGPCACSTRRAEKELYTPGVIPVAPVPQLSQGTCNAAHDQLNMRRDAAYDSRCSGVLLLS